MSVAGIQQRIGLCPSACLLPPACGHSHIRSRLRCRPVTAATFPAHRSLSCSRHSALYQRCQVSGWHTITPLQGTTTRGRHRQRSGRRTTTIAAGKGKSSGPFSPIVVVVRDRIGTKKFNQLRGQAISLHSQVIKTFGKNIGAEQKQVQGLIRLAKANGEKLGFLS